MKLKQILKITLLIIILAEEIKSVKGNKEFIPEDSNGFHFKKGQPITNPNQKFAIKASDISKKQKGLNKNIYI